MDHWYDTHPRNCIKISYNCKWTDHHRLDTPILFGIIHQPEWNYFLNELVAYQNIVKDFHEFEAIVGMHVNQITELINVDVYVWGFQRLLGVICNIY